MRRPNHAERTADEPRASDLIPVRISKIEQENASGSVKSYAFKFVNPIDRDLFTFKPGQWVDTHIPNISIVGGYSLISSAFEIGEKTAFELAIKGSSHSPAAWFHNRAKAGDEVSVRVGGSFFYPPPSELQFDQVILIAAGVGINPIMSMLRHISNIQNPPQVKLLYASKADEIMFLDRIRHSIDPANVELFLTAPPTLNVSLPSQYTNIRERRFTVEDVAKQLTEASRAVCYLCGPPQMTDEMERLLTDAQKPVKLDRKRLFLERWW